MVNKTNFSIEDHKIFDVVTELGKDTVESNVINFLKKSNMNDTDAEAWTFSIESSHDVKKATKCSGLVYGYCSYREKKIVLNVDHVLLSSYAGIVDTLLHECAHAVAGELYKEYGHGKMWRKVSTLFGSNPRATYKCDDKELLEKYKTSFKYKIVWLNKEKYSVTPVGECSRKLKGLGGRMQKHNRASLGNLWLVKQEDFKRLSNSFDSFDQINALCFR